MRDDIHEEYDANDDYTRAERMAWLYPPPPPRTRSQQFAAYMEGAAEDWPVSVVLPMWIGSVHRWLDHPCYGEEETFRGAEVELLRLSNERRTVWRV